MFVVYQAPAVVHCFTGTEEELQKCVEMGLYIGITGWVCDDREGSTRYIVALHIIEIPGLVPALHCQSSYYSGCSLR